MQVYDALGFLKGEWHEEEGSLRGIQAGMQHVGGCGVCEPAGSGS